MRLAVLSDIHGNLTALEAVLADLEAQGGADLTWCLGDLAAFGSRPKECIERIRILTEANEGKTFKTIGGNTDRYFLDGQRYPQKPAENLEELDKLRLFFQQWNTIIGWNLAQLSWEEYEFLKKINQHELAHKVDGYGVVIGYHAVPGHDEPMLRSDTPEEEAADYLFDREGKLGIGGHTHIQMNRRAGRWHLLNVGSVGMSVDNPGFAQYGILTFENGALDVDLRNIPYDVDAAIADLHAVNHPIPDWVISRIRPQAKV